ncbi:MAG: hypothetical protein J3R72DRAFT_494644 [Linnemannia gamsii]|nr:MAG: hypothetical protein J3R72DRAFT_494644 [Linnemannia gamsii]
MSYNQRNDNRSNRSLWDDGDKRRSNHPYSPNNSTSFYYKKRQQTSFDSNGFYSRERSTIDNYTRNYYHNKDRPRDDSREPYGRERPRDSDMDPFSRDRSRHAYRERQTQSNLGDDGRDRQDDDRERHDYNGFGDDERKRLGDFTSRYNNLSRSPSRDRGIDRGEDRGKNKESTSSDRSNICVRYSIHQDGRLYSNHRMYTPQYHGQSAFVKRDTAPLRSRWDQPPVDTSQTSIYQGRCDNHSSLLSQTPEMSRPSSVSSPETAASRSLMNQFSSFQPVTTTLISQATSTTASTTTLAVQNAVTNHFHQAQITAHSTMLQYHQQPQQTTPEDSRFKIVEAVADSYKALQNFRKQAGIKAADISVRDIMGKRPVGRPSKARLDTEEAILFGINCANSEMEQLEQATAELQVTTNGNEMVKYRHNIDINEVETVAPTTRLITSSSPQADIVSRSQHQVQGPQQVIQSTRSLKTRREWENYRQNLQGKDNTVPEGPRPQTIRQDSPLQMEPPPSKIMHRGSQPRGSCGEIYVDENTRLQSDESDEEYLGTPRPKLLY